MLKKLKTILYPILLVKKDASINLACQIYDGFQSVFVVQILACIVGAIQSHNLENFYFWLGIFVATRIISIIELYIGSVYFARVYSKLGYALTNIYLGKFIKLDNNKVESLGTGKSNSILLKGIDNWCTILIEDLEDFVINVGSIIYAFAIILFTVGFKYFAVMSVIFVIMVGVSYYGMGKTLKMREKRKDMQTEFDRGIIKVIMSKFEVLQNNRFSSETKKLDNLNNDIIHNWSKEETYNSHFQAIVMFLSNAIRIGVFVFIGIGVIKGNFSLSYFILVNGLIEVIDGYIWGTRRVIRRIGINIVGVNKLLETFDDIKEIPGINNPTSFIYSKGNINIKNLEFGYFSDNIFSNFSLDIAGGKKTALVGDSGSGKTTLMKLLAGYIHPKFGDIVVDNQNISQINLISYYKNIGYLTQEPSVFDGTIRENLIYALDREPTQEEVDETIKNSKCEFIYELTKGMETEIGERGVKLSGGQKQRLAIAKIMLKNPNIILLDEPTSALDSISEQVVSEAFHNLFKGRTVVIIAHRLQTVKEADEIIVLKKGEIIERGNHSELCRKQDGEYKKMLDLQTSF